MTSTKQLILVADDELDIVDSIAMLLELRGYRVVKAHNGEEAMKQMRLSRPDLAIMDLMMPDKNGWKMLSEKADDPSIAAIPTIALTGFSSVPEQVHANVVMTKPTNPGDLFDTVERLLAEPEKRQTTDQATGQANEAKTSPNTTPSPTEGVS